jgi:hypothetical protein
MFLNPLKSGFQIHFLPLAEILKDCVVSCLEAVFLVSADSVFNFALGVALSLAGLSAFLCEGLTSRFSTTPVP